MKGNASPSRSGAGVRRRADLGPCAPAGRRGDRVPDRLPASADRPRPHHRHGGGRPVGGAARRAGDLDAAGDVPDGDGVRRLSRPHRRARPGRRDRHCAVGRPARRRGDDGKPPAALSSPRRSSPFSPSATATRMARNCRRERAASPTRSALSWRPASCTPAASGSGPFTAGPTDVSPCGRSAASSASAAFSFSRKLLHESAAVIASGAKQSRRRRTALAALALALAPSAAEAHLVTTGLGPVYDGIAHFALSPEDYVPIVGAALLAGLRGKDHARLAVLVLPLAWFAGGVLGGLPGAPALAAPLWLPFLAVGLLVAADA